MKNNLCNLCILAQIIPNSWIMKVKFSTSQMSSDSTKFSEEIFTEFDRIAVIDDSDHIKYFCTLAVSVLP